MPAGSLRELDRAGRRLLDEQEKLTRRLENEALEIKREALRLEHLGETVLSWDEEGSLDAVCAAAQQVRGAYEPLKIGEMSIFAQPQSVFEAAQEATDALMNAMQEASHRLGRPPHGGAGAAREEEKGARRSAR